jgi:hypothetical protein
MRPSTLPVVTLLALAFVPPAGAKEAKAPAFVCTQVMGPSVTGDWFAAGFESGNDDARWQALTRTDAFVELWGDPKAPVWSEKVVSPCTKNSTRPDRVLLVGVNGQYTSADEWTAALTMAVKTIKAKYPGVKNIELLTTLRGPGNRSCGSPMTVVPPFVDEAVAKVAAAFPRLVTAGPKLEAPGCDVFAKGGPQFTPDGVARVANVYASHYLK